MATFKQLLDDDYKTNLISRDKVLQFYSLVKPRDMSYIVREYHKMIDELLIDYSFSQFLTDFILADHEFAASLPEYSKPQRITPDEERLAKIVDRLF